MPRPPFVVRAPELPSQPASYPAPFDGEPLSIGADVGSAAGSRRLGVWYERLLPGRRTSFTHAHLHEEELIYVLSGEPTLRWIQDGVASECALGPGDAIALPAGTGIAHTVWNRSKSQVTLLVVGERHSGERTTYPEDPEWQAWRDARFPQRRWSAERDEAARPPAVRLHTERLLMRPWTTQDVWERLALKQSEQERLAPWIPWATTVPSPDEFVHQARRWSEGFWRGTDLSYGLFDAQDKALGVASLLDRCGEEAREIGYWASAAGEGQGYISEAVRALIHLAFEVHELDRLEIHTDPANTRSRAVPERLGFTHEATRPRRFRAPDGTLHDSVIYTLYRSQYQPEGLHRSAVRAWDVLGRTLL